MLSDTQLALASLEICHLKLAKRKRKNKTPSFACHAKPRWGIHWKMQDRSFNSNYPFTLAISRMA